jgi:hypothetical protein
MATQDQSKYIADLTVLKTKDFKEVKELIVSAGIVNANSETVRNAKTIAEITGAMTDYQASRLIDALVAAKAPARDRAYSQTRIKKTVGILDNIKNTIDGWDFN